MAVIRRTKLRGLATRVLAGVGAPSNSVPITGAGKAVPGSVYIDMTPGAARQWRNEGTLATPVWTIIGRMVIVFSLGRNGAGSLTLAGTKVGDQVAFVYNITTPGDSTANFESVITVAGAIQQSSASNLSAVNHLFFIQR